MQNGQRNLQAEIFTAARTIQNDFEAARSRERELNAALQRQQTEVQALNGKAVLYTALEHEATTNRQVLDTLLQRSREAALARRLETTNVRVVDWAEVPMSPVLPRKERTMLVAFGGSGIFALGINLPARALQYSPTVTARGKAAFAYSGDRGGASSQRAQRASIAASRQWGTCPIR